MIGQDYIVKNGNENIIIESKKKVTGQEIIKDLVYERKRLGLTQQDIADKTGMKAPNVTRVEGCKFTPTLDVLERYAQAVGKKIKIELVDME